MEREWNYYSSEEAERQHKRETFLRALTMLVVIILALWASGISETTSLQTGDETSASSTMQQMNVTQ